MSAALHRSPPTGPTGARARPLHREPRRARRPRRPRAACSSRSSPIRSGWPFTPNDIDLLAMNKGPSAKHWFGTDGVGRDVLARLLQGGRISLLVAVVVGGPSRLVIGFLVGAVVGLRRPLWPTRIAMRSVDLAMTLPPVIFLLVLASIIGTGIWPTIVVISLLSWPVLSRMVRARLLELRERDFVVASRGMGAGLGHLLFRHGLPNSHRHPRRLRDAAGRQRHPARGRPLLPRPRRAAARGELGQHAERGALHRGARAVSPGSGCSPAPRSCSRCSRSTSSATACAMPSTRAPISTEPAERNHHVEILRRRAPRRHPAQPRLQVDYPSYTRVLEYLIEGGVHGLFVLGSTSEVVFHRRGRPARDPRVTRRQGERPRAGLRRRHRPDHRPGDRPRQDRAVGRRRCRGRHRALLHPHQPARDHRPLPLRQGRGRHARSIAYDIPVCVHTKLERKTTVTLAREGTIAGLKDSSGDDGNFRYALLDLADTPDVFLMTGSEIVVDNALHDGRARRRPRPRQRRPARLRPALGRCPARRLGGGARGAGAALPPVRDRLGRRRPRRAPARPASAASRPRCAASASSPPTSWPGRSAPLNDDEAAKVDAILRAVGLC